MSYGILKLFYFCFSLGTGAFQFLNLFYVDHGLTPSQIGVLFAVGPLVMIIAQPLWGMLTDYWNSTKITLMILILCSAATALFFPFTFSFTHLLMLNIIYFFFHSAIPPIADVTAMSLLTDRNDFGKIRLWGSIGYAVGVLTIGKTLDFFGLQLMFFLHSGLIVFALLLALKLPANKSGKKHFKIKEAMGLFKNRPFIMLLLFSFFLHLTVHANNSFYSIYLQNLGATITIIGFALLIKSILEVPFFAVSKKLMIRYSYPILLSGVALMYALRWLVLGVSDNLQVLIWSQILLSFSYSVQYFVAVAYVDVITPKKYRATGQTIYWAIALGLGGLIGNILAGWIVDYVNIAYMYQLATGVSLLCIAFLWLKPKQGKEQQIGKTEAIQK